MSFVRQDRHVSSKKMQSKTGGRAKKKIKKRMPAWDGTTSDLSVHKLSKSELERRREVHKSSNLPAVKAEQQMRSLIKGRGSNREEMDRSTLLQEILYDEAQLRDAVGYSDRIMSVVHDLFGDDPSKTAGRANVTLAPGVDGERRAAKMLPDMTLNPSHLDILSDSVMDPHALNELDVDDEYSDEDSYKENTPESYKGALDLERFRRYIEKESEAKNERRALKGQRQKSKRTNNRRPKKRGPLEETHQNNLSDVDSDAEAQEATRVQAINDTAKVKKKSRARTAMGDATQEQQTNRDLATVIRGVQEEVQEYERATGHEVLRAEDMLSGSTVVLVQTIQTLLHHLTQKEVSQPDGLSSLNEKVEEQSNLINALTLELMSTQERLSRLEGQLQVLSSNDGLSTTTREPHLEVHKVHGGIQQSSVLDGGNVLTGQGQPVCDINPGHLDVQNAENLQQQQLSHSASGRSTEERLHHRKPQSIPVIQRKQLRSEGGCGTDSEGTFGHHIPTDPSSSAGSGQQAHPQQSSMQPNRDMFTMNSKHHAQSSSDCGSLTLETHQGARVSHPQLARRMREGVFTPGQAILLSPPRQRDRHSLLTVRGIQGIQPIVTSRGDRQGDDPSQSAWPPNSVPVGAQPQRKHHGSVSDSSQRNASSDDRAEVLTPAIRDGDCVSVTDAASINSTGYPDHRPRPMINPFTRGGGVMPGRLENSNKETLDLGIRAATEKNFTQPLTSNQPNQGMRTVWESSNPRMVSHETYPQFVGNSNILKEQLIPSQQSSSFQTGPTRSESAQGPKDASLLSTDSASTYHSLPPAQVAGNPMLTSSAMFQGNMSGSDVFAVPSQEWDFSGVEGGSQEGGAVQAISDLTRKIAALTKEHAEAEERLQNMKIHETA